MARSLRFLAFIIAAVVLNLLLFYFIQEMVSRDQDGIRDYEDINMVDFVRLEQQEQEQEQRRREEEPPEPPPEEQEQPPPEVAKPEAPQPERAQPEMPAPNIDIPLGIDGMPYVGDFMKSPPPEQPRAQAPDTSGILTDIQPTSKVPPQYPPRALRSGIEGSVTVEFTITKEGEVRDPEIVEADPAHIFNDAVLRSIRRWKFEPQRVEGELVERRARQVVRFQLQ